MSMATSGTHGERNRESRLGYECEFVHPPPSYLQTECSICLLILRSPHITSCCGHNFCKRCIEGVRMAGKGCPLCNAKGFSLVYNRTHDGTLKQLEVYCTHRMHGCEWKEKLEMLEKHLNVDSQPQAQLQGCVFVEAKCCHNGCGQFLKRNLLDNHQSKECPQRPFSCQHCKHYKSTFRDVTTNHWPVCERYPVSCPNNCTPNKIQRRNLQQHLSEKCPLQEVECEFKYAGCETKVCRKNMSKHISNPRDMACHMSLLARQNCEQNTELTRELRVLARQNQKLSEQNTELTRELRMLAHQNQTLSEQNTELTRKLCEFKHQVEFILIAPVRLLMTDFERRKKDGDEWFSEGFYTHPWGYKMCLIVYANRYEIGKGIHVSCFVRLLRGKFDSTLKWPFRGNVTVQLLNQRGNSGHHTKTIPFVEKVPDTCNILATCGDRAAKALGYPTFIHHGDLEHKPYANCQYLMNNSLSFRIEVKVL